MTATPGAPDPRGFEAIVARLDGAELERAANQPDAVPAQDMPVPAAPTQATAPSAAPLPEPPPEPPPLVIPDRPQRPSTGVVNAWAAAFPHIVWLSVVAGLAGQVFGFAEFFGGTVPAWIVAAALGGTFEFMMVSCSSRGLRAIGLGRTWAEYAPFLVLGTSAAGFAAFMNVSHFAGWLGLAAGAVTVLGYLAHVFSHLYDELDYRAQVAEWEVQRAAVQARIDARDDARRAAHEQYLADVDKARRRQVAATNPTPPSPPAAEPQPPRTAPPTKKSAAPASAKATKDVAVQLGVDTGAATPSALRKVLTERGYALPSSKSTVENWCKDIKTRIAERGGA